MLCLARCSSAITRAALPNASVFQLAAIPIACLQRYNMMYTV
jgi:hypothetical protein